MVNMDIVEGRELAKIFKAKGKRAKDASERTLLAAGAMLSREAKRLVPHKGGHGRRPTGKLKASIAHKLIRRREGLADVLVGTRVYYATFVEMGTGQAGKEGMSFLNEAQDYTGKLKAVGLTVHKYGGRKNRPNRRSRDFAGMRPHPFLVPARNIIAGKFQALVAAELEKAVLDGDENG